MKPSNITNLGKSLSRLFTLSLMPVFAAALLLTASPSLLKAQQKDDPRTRGKLAILGIRSEESIKPIQLPSDSYLVLIEPTKTGTEKLVPADTAPLLASPASASERAETPAHDQSGSSRKYFVCLINHLPPEETTLLNDAEDGKWDNITFLEAVLIADGVSTEERSACMKIYNRHLFQLRNKTSLVKNDFEKARIVYEYLHSEILTGSYDLKISSVAASLQTGTYNCVSATALFNALAGDVGLTSYGLEMTGHAKSRILCGDSYLDIETTCPKWDLLPDRPRPIPENEPGTETWARDAAFIKQVNYIESTSSYPPEEDSESSQGSEEFQTPREESDSDPVTPEKALMLSGKRPVRTVTPVQFVATIYYNRAVDYYQEKQFDNAIYAYLKAIAIDPNNKTVLGNFKATLNNLAIELASRNKNYLEAIRLTEHGLTLDPNFDQFRVNLPLYYQHWSSELRKNNQLEEALKVETRYRRSHPEFESKIF